MAGMRMSMRKIREVLRLTHELGLSVREVCEATGVGKTAVCEYVNRARVIGITWPIPPLIDDAGLERRLFTPADFHAGSTKPLPDWTKVHEELKRRGVTLMILWEEHRAEHVDGHGYSRFCELYSAWRKRLSPTMRQTYVAGDKLFVAAVRDGSESLSAINRNPCPQSPESALRAPSAFFCSFPTPKPSMATSPRSSSPRDCLNGGAAYSISGTTESLRWSRCC